MGYYEHNCQKHRDWQQRELTAVFGKLQPCQRILVEQWTEWVLDEDWYEGAEDRVSVAITMIEMIRHLCDHIRIQYRDFDDGPPNPSHSSIPEMLSEILFRTTGERPDEMMVIHTGTMMIDQLEGMLVGLTAGIMARDVAHEEGRSFELTVEALDQQSSEGAAQGENPQGADPNCPVCAGRRYPCDTGGAAVGVW